MANKQLGTRHDEKLIARLGLRAELFGTSLAQYVNDALELYVGFDDKFLKALKGLAADMGVEPWDLIQRRFAKWFGKIDAYYEIYGAYPDFVMDTITQGDFDTDYNMHKQHKITKIEKSIVAKALESEKYGVELEDYEKRLLMKYHLGQAWANSEEFKREQEMKELEREIEKMSPEEIESFIEELEKLQRNGPTGRKNNDSSREV